MPNYLEIVRLHEAGFSLRKIAKIVASGRSTVTRTVKIAQEKDLMYEVLSQWSFKEIEEMFSLPQTKQVSRYYVLPDFQQIAKELVKPGVTLQLLWEEYAQDCRLEGKVFYQLTQFKKHLNEYLNKTNFSHILHHKAGEQAQVDWAKYKALHFAQSTSTFSPGEC